jgi:O-antigen ligase
MNPPVAAAVYVLLVLMLLWWGRERKGQTSAALWIPALWLLINGSRPVSTWFGTVKTTTENLEGSPVDATIFGVLLLSAVCVLAWRRNRALRLLTANTPVLLYFAYCAVSVFWADHSDVAFKRWIKAVGDLAVVMVVLTDVNPTAALRRLLSQVAFILLPLSILFIKYYPELGRAYDPWNGHPIYCGVTLFKNLLGITCLVAGLGSWWSFLAAYKQGKGRDRGLKMAAHAIVIAMAMHLFLTADSMTSFSCFVLGGILITMASLRWTRNKPVRIHFLVAALIALPLVALFLPGTNMVQSLGRDATLTGRTAIWNAAISVAKYPLIGAGFESFWTGERLRTIWRLINEPGIQEAHDGYLEVYLNLGWIGVTLLAILLARGYRNVIRAFRRDWEGSSIRLAFFVVGVVFSLTEAGFRMMSLVWIFFLFSAMATPAAKRRKEAWTCEEPAERALVPTGVSFEDAIETI